MATKGVPWADCFAKVTNGEWRAVCARPFTGPQLRIVILLLTETRGTGAINGGLAQARLDAGDDPAETFEEALEGYGRDGVAITGDQIAARLEVNPSVVRRELARLEAANVVRILRRGHKGRPQLLTVNLDSSTWRDLETWDLQHPRRRAGARYRANIPRAFHRPDTSADGDQNAVANSPQKESLAVVNSPQQRPDSVANSPHTLRKRPLTSFESNETAESDDPTGLTISSNGRTCRFCHAPLPPQAPTGRPRRFCSHKCCRHFHEAERRSHTQREDPRHD